MSNIGGRVEFNGDRQKFKIDTLDVIEIWVIILREKLEHQLLDNH